MREKAIPRIEAPLPADGFEIVLDLTRLLSRVLHATPTGIDRVEMAYARHLWRRVPERLSFAATHPCGSYGRLSSRAVLRFLDVTETRWSGTNPRPQGSYRHAVQSLATLIPGRIPVPTVPRIVLKVSPSQLHSDASLARRLRVEGGRFACLVHDLIPIDYPEYARPDGSARHAARIANIARHADLVLTNSHATAAALGARLGQWGLVPPRTVVAPLGVTDASATRIDAPGLPPGPYFVCLGTIEPRKNHLLLLNLWRRLTETLSAEAVPRLILVGRRGWENENVLDMLDRCTALRGVVHEYGRLPDAALAGLIRGARALLMPSFAEGFGMPVAEALAARVPVIASDLPAHREAGGGAAEYLDPLDGNAWLGAIRDYAAAPSPRRQAQCERIARFAPVRWDAHFDIVLGAIEELASC